MVWGLPAWGMRRAWKNFFQPGEGRGRSKLLLLTLKLGKIEMRSQVAEQGTADGHELQSEGRQIPTWKGKLVLHDSGGAWEQRL